MATTIPSVPTVGEIARQVGKPIHRIDYIIVSVPPST